MKKQRKNLQNTSKIKVFLDTSVLIAGFGSPTGASWVILSMIKNRDLQGFISSELTKEAIRNLSKKFSSEVGSRFCHYLACEYLRRSPSLEENDIETFRNQIATKDVHIIASAFKAKVDYLLSLDQKHILSIRSSGLSFKILSPGEFLGIFE